MTRFIPIVVFCGLLNMADGAEPAAKLIVAKVR